jgi:hypothetical protein
MESNEIYLEYKSCDILVNAYQEQCQQKKSIFMTDFLESLGLRYVGKTQTIGVRFFVEDSQKFFLAKIQYGL